MTVEFGFGLITCARFPGDPRDDIVLYGEALDLCEYAERLGFDSVWTSEHHFLDDCYMPSVLTACAAIAARTERVRVGTGVLLAPLIHPLRLAEDAATVDVISGGRLVLGLGLGWREEEFSGLGVASNERVPRFERAIAVLRAAGAGELADGVAVTPPPAQPGGVPIWIGAGVEPAVRRAGRLADGFMAADVPPDELAEHVRWIREELERAGRDPEAFTYSVHVGTFAWHDQEEVWERLCDYLSYGEAKYDDMALARGSKPPPTALPQLPLDRQSDLRRRTLLGTPEEVAERIREYEEAAEGRLHYIARMYVPGLDAALQREVMEAFAQEVIPLLR
jgi:alkanesulfonate monooxygenase SsuD/methylene tetrahydromethanopterin reductase-like flavin-dependent oxidoreductase (luciferase family)